MPEVSSFVSGANVTQVTQKPGLVTKPISKYGSLNWKIKKKSFKPNKDCTTNLLCQEKIGKITLAR